jgi:uncharacterized protein (DUF433 family)
MAMQWTTSEAAVVAGLPVRAVNKAIEKGAIPSVVLGKGAARRRYLAKAALICLRLDAEGFNRLPLGFRKKVFQSVLSQPQAKYVEPVGFLRVDIASPRRKIVEGLRMLHRANSSVSVSPEVMGGVPVVRGTRIPVQLLAEMVAKGASVEEIVSGYPSLTTEQVRLAVLYAEAHPRRGRPVTQPWHEKTARRSSRTAAVSAE